MNDGSLRSQALISFKVVHTIGSQSYFIICSIQRDGLKLFLIEDLIHKVCKRGGNTRTNDNQNGPEILSLCEGTVAQR